MILKFQQGGSALPPLVSYLPVTVTGGTQAASGASSTKSGKGEDLTDKDLLEMLGKLNGLPNDVEYLTKSLQQFYINDKYNALPSTSSIESRYLSILSLMQKANFNRKEYDNAYNKVSSNGGISELAITELGKLVCSNADGTDFKLLSIDDLENYSGYTPLTNQDLLLLRAYDKTLSFNSNLLGIVLNGIGIEAVNKLINLAVTMLGSSTKKDEGYLRTDSKKLISGLLDYVKAASTSLAYNTSIDNLYKTNILTKSLAEQASLAIDYVWETLPVNAKTLLRTKTKDGSVKSAKLLVADLITSKTSTTQLFDISLETSKGKSTKGNNSGNGSDVKTDPVKAFILGKGYSQPIGINVGNSYTHNVNGRYGVLTDKTGNALGANSTLEDVTGSAYAGVLDINSATFGGVQLNTNLGRRVLLDSADIVGMDLPIDLDAKSKGIIRPDLHMLSRLEQAEDVIRYNNITDPEQINKIYVEHDLPEKFKNLNGTYNLNLLSYQRFARLSGVVEESALPEDIELDGTVLEIEDENFRASIESVILSKDKDYSMSNGWWGTELYRGAIYIPVREDMIAASLGSGEYYELGEATLVEKDWEQTQKVQGYQKPASLGTLK